MDGQCRLKRKNGKRISFGFFGYREGDKGEKCE